jgi:hypothetical protein
MKCGEDSIGNMTCCPPGADGGCSTRCTNLDAGYVLARVELRGADAGHDDDDRTGGAAVAQPTVFVLLAEGLVSGKVLLSTASAD